MVFNLDRFCVLIECIEKIEVIFKEFEKLVFWCDYVLVYVYLFLFNVFCYRLESIIGLNIFFGFIVLFVLLVW